MKKMPRKHGLGVQPNLGRPPKPMKPELVSPPPREVEAVDIDALVNELDSTQGEVDTMQAARQGLKERLLASEAAVSAALRAYSANPDDTALAVVDNAKEDEKQARLRLHTNRDSLNIRQKDLAVLQERHDTAMLDVIRERKHKLLKQRQKQLPAQIDRVRKALTELLITEHLAGLPIGVVDIKSFILSRMPDIKVDASEQADALVRGLK